MSESPSDRSNGFPGTRPLTESDAHRLLSSARRRILLDVLEDRQPPIDLDALAAAVAERELGAESSEAVPAGQVAISLHHVHLPKLDEVGVVDYAAASNQVEAFRDRLSH